jgi:hypothetical protein
VEFQSPPTSSRRGSGNSTHSAGKATSFSTSANPPASTSMKPPSSHYSSSPSKPTSTSTSTTTSSPPKPTSSYKEDNSAGSSASKKPHYFAPPHGVEEGVAQVDWKTLKLRSVSPRTLELRKKLKEEEWKAETEAKNKMLGPQILRKSVTGISIKNIVPVANDGDDVEDGVEVQVEGQDKGTKATLSVRGRSYSSAAILPLPPLPSSSSPSTSSTTAESRRMSQSQSHITPGNSTLSGFRGAPAPQLPRPSGNIELDEVLRIPLDWKADRLRNVSKRALELHNMMVRMYLRVRVFFR